MLVNRFLSTKRHSSHEVVSLAPLDPRRVTPASLDDWNPDHDTMWAVLTTLPARQRAVLVLRYYEDLPDDTIAAILGCAPSTVRSLAFRAMGTLRDKAAGRLLSEHTG